MLVCISKEGYGHRSQMDPGNKPAWVQRKSLSSKRNKHRPGKTWVSRPMLF